MNVLGIETSCDETAASVVKDGKVILSNIVTSSLKDHTRFGGIIPEIASRRQLEWISDVVGQALKEAEVSLKDINAIAVTEEPGLIGSLLVGVSFARALSFATRKPLISINHIKAHLYANFLALPSQKNSLRPTLPAIGLVVSGGHSSLFLLENFHHYKLLGQTRDDAVGETFDKVARMLGLGYPGGPIIDQLAKKGINKEIRFKCADLPNSFDFSFSGIKTAVLYHKNRFEHEKDFSIPKIAYAFQKSAVSILVQKSIQACQKKKIKTLLIGGGVAANSELRQNLTEEAAKHNIRVFFPPMNLCLDNAAMIAGLGYQLLKKAK